MEDSLTLDELYELYDMSFERQFRTMKMLAASLGSDIGDYKSILNRPEDNNQNYVYDGSDLAQLPIGIGYAKVE